MELKKRLFSFLKSEKGGITKKALVDGAVAAGLVFALSHAVAGQFIHTNTSTVSVSCTPAAPNCDTASMNATHTNHSNHSNHSNY